MVPAFTKRGSEAGLGGLAIQGADMWMVGWFDIRESDGAICGQTTLAEESCDRQAATAMSCSIA